jgi:hypothetical protein
VELAVLVVLLAELLEQPGPRTVVLVALVVVRDRLETLALLTAAVAVVRETAARSLAALVLPVE